MKLAGWDVASLFARDAGWSVGHVLHVAARAEDERDARFIPPTACDRPNIDYQMELLIFKMARYSLYPSHLLHHQNQPLPALNHL